VAVVVCVAGFVLPAAAQVEAPIPERVGQMAAAHGELQGVVTDDRGAPLPGAVVSALGATTAFAVTDSAGRFAFRTLPPGPYLVRAHLQGFVPARARMIQINAAARAVSALRMTRKGAPGEPTEILAAGVAVDIPAATAAPEGEDHDHSEAAWRLRHLKRSVLKEADTAVVVADGDESIWDPLETVGRAVSGPARLAGAFFADLPVNGEVNLLTTTSFDSPQELFSMHDAPRGVAFVSLNAPTGRGDWNIRGATMQGDLSSWVVAGSYVRRSPAAHQFEAGLSYGMQHYGGGNPAALVAVAEDNRNAGSVYAYDRWTIVPAITLQYGAEYARYDYLDEDHLFSPRAALTISPTKVVRVRVAASRNEVAPGAGEFLPPGASGVWLPPERTFSPVSARRGFRAERVDHIEVAAEHDTDGNVIIGLRAFRQRIDDQIVTLFGLAPPEGTDGDLGHYYVGSAGSVDTHGWGVSISRQVGAFRGSIDYTRTEADWVRRGPDWRLLSLVAGAASRQDRETLHDLTASMHTEVPLTATRVYVLYKLNNGFATQQSDVREPKLGTRFDVQVNQALPFLNFTSAQWEMLVSVRNLFREDLLDASPYDELLVVKPPKRVVGGLTVRF
jgi:hypothetical protein